MKKFVIEDEFFEIFPDAQIAIVILKDINNQIVDKDKYKSLLEKTSKEALTLIDNDDFSKNKIIADWRWAYQQFKTKKGARSSIEALFKRVKKGQDLSCINPLVDIYNAISLKYGIPCGGEDIDTFEGHVKLTKAVGDEAFITLGSDKSEPPYKDEIIYKDDAGAICRCWNWRESVRTMLTEDTKQAFMCLELINDERLDDLKDAVHDLSEMVTSHLGGTYRIEYLNKNNPVITL